MANNMLDEKRTKSIGYNKLVVVTLVIMLVLKLSLIPISQIAFSESFGNNFRVDDTGLNITNQTWPDIAVFNDDIYIVWDDNRLSGIHNTNIFFAKSTDNGLSFRTNVRVDNAPIGAAACPSIAIDKSNGNIYVVWQDYRNSPNPYSVDIYCSNSTDGGNSFGADVRVISDTSGNFQDVPSVAANDGLIGVVWHDWNDGTYFSNSTDGGQTFGENKKINDIPNGDQFYPDIKIDDNGVIYVVWEHKIDGNYNILFSKSADGGNTWTPSLNVSNDPFSEGQRMPSLTLDKENNIYVVWRERKNGNFDIYHTKSTDGGSTFNSSIEVSQDFGNEMQFQPSIAVNDAGKIFVTWLEDKDFPNSTGVSDIYFANSTDGGITFSPKQKINNCPSFSSVYTPSNAIAVWGNHAFIVWQDDRKGDWDIYFTRSNWEPPMTNPISPPSDSIVTNNTPTLIVNPVTDPDNDTIYNNFTISDQPDAESGTVYFSGWITSTSWKPPPLSDGKWYWHTYTSDMWNTTSPNWIWNFTVDTSQSYGIWLYGGWNLISIPFIQMNTDLESVLDSINGSYDAVQWYNTNDSPGSWKHYHVSKPFHLNDLKDMDHTIGFWIRITEPGGVLFQCSGILPTENQSINLYPGWNLVGYPSLSNKTRTVALNNITYGVEVDSIWAYNATTQKWEEIGPTDYFELGRGYWIHSKVTKTWIVPL